MKELANLVLSGFVTGAIYSVMASGLVLTYATSGILNFAHGAIAFTTAYLYFQLHTAVGLPIVPALLISVLVFAPLLGLVLDVVLLRRLARAPVYARVVGTIGLLVTLPNLAQLLVKTVFIKVLGWDLPGNDALNSGTRVPGIGPSPARSFQPLHGVALNTDQIAVLVVSAVAAFMLWIVIRHTRLGLEMRAVVDRDSLAGLRGINSGRTSAVAWVMTMVLAGLGGVLIAPLFTLTDYVYTLVVLGSLAVVVLGRLRSIPIAFAGGLALGVVQNLVAGYGNDVLPDFLAKLSGLKTSVPYILVLVLLLVFGRERGRRGGSVAEDVPRPDHRAGMSAVRRRLPWAIATVLFVAYALQWFGVHWFRADTYGQTVIANGLALAVVFLSFVVVTGLGGMVSLAQAAFVTAGGFAAGWLLSKRVGFDVPGLITNGHINFFFAIVVGALGAGLVGIVIAVAVTRLSGVSVALGSLAFAFLLSLVIFPLNAIRHSQTGWSIRPPTLDVPGLNWLHDQIVVGGHQPFFDTSQLPDQILLFLIVFGVITLGIHAFQRSASGRAVLAIRSSEVAAESVGIRVVRTKVLMFGLSAAIAGVGGVLLGLFSSSITDTTASPLIGLSWLALVVTFGVRRPGGALIAGLLFTGGTAALHWIGGALPGGAINDIVTSQYFVPMLSGLGAIQLAQEPDGIIALRGHRKLAKARAKAGAATVATALPVAVTPSGAAAGSASEVSAVSTAGSLELRGIVGGYGDAEVIHGVSLTLR
ncbi:MAG TPA: ABC transporter permease, partial [Ilumatobacteraceae bacterium]